VRTIFLGGALCCFAASIISIPNPGDTQNAQGTPVAAGPHGTIRGSDAQPFEPRRDAFTPAVDLSREHVPPPRAPRATLRVTAIVNGERPGAIVESPDGAHAVGVGDALDGSAVSAIGPGVVLLADGRKLYLGGGLPY